MQERCWGNRPGCEAGGVTATGSAVPRLAPETEPPLGQSKETGSDKADEDAKEHDENAQEAFPGT